MAIRPYANIGVEEVSVAGVEDDRAAGVMQAGAEFEIAEVLGSAQLVLDPFVYLTGGGGTAATSAGIGCRVGPTWNFGAVGRWRVLPFFETRVGEGLGQTQVNGYSGWHEEGGQYLAGLGCTFDWAVSETLGVRLGGYALGGPAQADVAPYPVASEYQRGVIGVFAGFQINLNGGRRTVTSAPISAPTIAPIAEA
jgi:hypothetical protein